MSLASAGTQKQRPGLKYCSARILVECRDLWAAASQLAQEEGKVFLPPQVQQDEGFIQTTRSSEKIRAEAFLRTSAQQAECSTPKLPAAFHPQAKLRWADQRCCPLHFSPPLAVLSLPVLQFLSSSLRRFSIPPPPSAIHLPGQPRNLPSSMS